MFWYFSICLQREAEYWRCYRFRQLWRHAHKRCAGDVCLLRHFCMFICLKTTHSHVLFFHLHNTLQILIGDSKVTSKLAKINHLFLILWWCLISYFRTLQLVRVVDLFFKLDYFLKTTHSHGLIFHSNITLEILIIES